MMVTTPAGNAGAINSLITNPTTRNVLGLGASYYSGTKGMINNAASLKSTNGN